MAARHEALQRAFWNGGGRHRGLFHPPTGGDSADLPASHLEQVPGVPVQIGQEINWWVCLLTPEV